MSEVTFRHVRIRIQCLLSIVLGWIIPLAGTSNPFKTSGILQKYIDAERKHVGLT